MMLRHLFLFLSARKGLRRWMEQSALSKKFTRRFIAGEKLDDALRVLEHLERERIWATLDHLGENVTTIEEAAASRDSYLEALARIEERKLPSTVSIKLTQFGLDLSQEVCVENVRQLTARAKAIGSRVEIDMESSAYTDRTLEIAARIAGEFGCARTVIQAYLFRSAADIERMNALAIPVRLCKGAYDEPPSVAFPEKRDVDRNYVTLMKTLLDHGAYPAIATHDEAIIGEAFRYARQRRITPDRFEFQMLYGIRRDLQKRVVDLGYRLRLYVPYGTAWYPYFMRRLAERPANVLFLLRNLFR
ncbi:MAG TPA: proline dehydrogenase family protein [Bryobacteraceae bacterium]|jgi:proline dehydrogenase|nr:proline dehydrogenase family protein [Bryobacteraceae bacterium]